MIISRRLQGMSLTQLTQFIEELEPENVERVGILNNRCFKVIGESGNIRSEEIMDIIQAKEPSPELFAYLQEKLIEKLDEVEKRQTFDLPKMLLEKPFFLDHQPIMLIFSYLDNLKNVVTPKNEELKNEELKNKELNFVIKKEFIRRVNSTLNFLIKNLDNQNFQNEIKELEEIQKDLETNLKRILQGNRCSDSSYTEKIFNIIKNIDPIILDLLEKKMKSENLSLIENIFSLVKIGINAREIPDPDERSDYIIEQLVKINEIERAISFAYTVNRAGYTERDHAFTAETLNEEMEGYPRDRALWVIAQKLLDIVQIEDAEDSENLVGKIELAQKLAEKITHEMIKDTVLSGVAFAFFNIGEFEKAYEVSNSFKAHTLVIFHREVVRKLLKMGEIEEALAVANSIQDNDEREQFLIFIAQKILEVRGIEEALAVADSIQDNSKRDTVLICVIRKLVAMDEIEKSREIAQFIHIQKNRETTMIEINKKAVLKELRNTFQNP